MENSFGENENLAASQDYDTNTCHNAQENEQSNTEQFAGQYPCSPAPPVEIKLFVGRIPRTMVEEDIKPIFETYGPVKEIAIIRDKTSNVHKGSAFVRMVSISHADAAIRSLNNQKILEAGTGPMQVKYATGEAEKLNFTDASAEPGLDQAKLFIGSLPKTITEDEVKELFSVFGNVDEVFIMKDGNSGAHKGCGFVKYAFKEQAMFAIRSWDKNHTLPGAQRALEIRFAEGKKTNTSTTNQFSVGNQFPTANAYGTNVYGYGQNPMIRAAPAVQQPLPVCHWKEYFSSDGRAYYHNELTNLTQWERPAELDQFARMRMQMAAAPGASAALAMNQERSGPVGANIFIFHIPNEWTEDDLIASFSKFGTIVSARIATERGSGRNKGFGFVSYDKIKPAVDAVVSMNGCMAAGKRLKVTIKKGEEHAVQHLMPAAMNTDGASIPNSTNSISVGVPGVGMSGISSYQVIPNPAAVYAYQPQQMPMQVPSVANAQYAQVANPVYTVPPSAGRYMPY